MLRGPDINWGTKKYLISSLGQSLRRMQLDYIDIFYHHRPDSETPIGAGSREKVKDSVKTRRTPQFPRKSSTERGLNWINEAL
jgi:aryl-alcohol dehydrogenase-like predicted oxidoreductase